MKQRDPQQGDVSFCVIHRSDHRKYGIWHDMSWARPLQGDQKMITITREELLSHDPCPKGLAEFDRLCALQGDPTRWSFEWDHLSMIWMSWGYSQYVGWLRSVGLLPKINLSGANLHGADLCGADLGGADLSGADLHGANLHGANLHGADLHEADLREADLGGADLRGAYLHWADLHGANLHGANLHGADLRGADLRGADLYGADLRWANLYGAYLRGAYMSVAYLRGADLCGAYLSSMTRAPEGWISGNGILRRAP